MKRITLPILVMISFITFLHAQKKQKDITGYAITAPQKGQTGWREVRLINMNTGEVLQTIYSSTDQPELLNARTGKAVVKKDPGVAPTAMATFKKVVNLDQEIDKSQARVYGVLTLDSNNKRQITQVNGNSIAIFSNGNLSARTAYFQESMMSADKPFSTNSAAMAYDKKHERLYYTPMNINQLRYIDLSSKSSKIYYFEDESFGKAGFSGDGANQITRMVIASDGDGYALSNDGNHLIKFTTNKKAEITDLGALNDDAGNKVSVHSRSGFGGDMIADASENLYLITANRSVFKISIESKSATFQGTIKGLPAGFTSNGALVGEGSKVIVCSGESTVGYYSFDLSNLDTPAEKMATNGAVYNASDLANGNLAFAKNKKDKKDEEKSTAPVVKETSETKTSPDESTVNKGIMVYPNPVTSGVVRLSFADQPAGRYQIELLDLSGKLINTEEVNINNKIQIEEFRFPGLSVKGSYLIRVSSEKNKISITNKLVVQ